MRRRLRLMAARLLTAAARVLLPEAPAADVEEPLPPRPVTLSPAALAMVEEGERAFREEAEKKATARAAAHAPPPPRPGSLRARAMNSRRNP